MPVSYSRKRLRDQALHARWDALPDSHFKRLGISRDDLKSTQLGLHGHIVVPGDPTYDQDRLLFNPIFDPHPQAIVFCKLESDVRLALALGQLGNSPFCIRSSGHCTAGFSSGPGLLIDVSALDSTFVDTADQTLLASPGCQFGDLFKTLDLYDLHVPGGECPDVCVGGYVQGGGYGFTSVTYGMNCDNVLSMRVMLADGSVVIASPTTNYDLWWAMRGGTGGNFGVLLTVTYQLRPLTTAFGWALAWPLADAQDIANATNVMMLLQQSYMLSSNYAPAMNIQVSFCYQTQLDPNQPPSGNPKPYLMVRGLYVGDSAAGAAAIQPLQAMPGCVTQWTRTERFVKLNSDLLNYPQSMPLLTAMPFEDKSSHYVERTLSADEWGSILSYFANKGIVNGCYGYLEFYGGAINSYPLDQSAFVHRGVAFNAVMDVFWYENVDRAAAEQFLNGWNHLLEQMWNGHIYQNYASLVAPDYAHNYWGSALAGLYAVKCKYDPGNAFTFQQQVRAPLQGGGGPGPVIPLPPALAAALAQPISYDGGAKAPHSVRRGP